MYNDKEVAEIVGIVIVGILFIVGLMFLEAWLGCWLWGVIAVSIFGLPALTYWQFFGLMVLVGIIFPTPAPRMSKKD